MIGNRELTTDDYLAMLRRRVKLILIPVLLAPLAGYGISWLAQAKYRAQATILVEGQKVPENMVQPVVSEDLTARVATLKDQVLIEPNLASMVERLQLAKGDENVSDMIGEIRTNTSTEPADSPEIGIRKRPGQGSTVPEFYVNYDGSSPRQAQMICNELASQIVDQNRRSVAAIASGTSDVLSKGLEDAKHNLDDLDGKLAAFKKQYVGQLPGDEENNLKILAGLNSQLDANTQSLNRAQQDKAYTESMLAQQITTWKSSQNSTNPQVLEKQLSELQSQLLDLQARYTDDHPDVIKTKADIAEVKKKLAEVNNPSPDAADAASDKGSALEPPDIRQLRLQIHQYTDMIAAGNRDQKRLQQEIGEYQGRVSLSPAIEEQYKELTRDYDNALKGYQDLLAKKGTADMTVRMNTQEEGERMFVLNAAVLPDSPSSPNRWLYAGGGLAAGLALGLGLAMWMELRDKAIRTEADAEAVLELPMLVAVPWVGVEAAHHKNGTFKFWKRKSAEEHKEVVGA